MNIFVLDENIDRCARYHCDQHVVKMILESAQLLCTALNKKGFVTPYRSTHVKHPCVLWVEESYSNFQWLTRLAFALNREYLYRYQGRKDHRSVSVIQSVQDMRFDDHGLTPFAQAMPKEYQVRGNAVTAYRKFYIGEKLHFATWTRRRRPAWIRPAESTAG